MKKAKGVEAFSCKVFPAMESFPKLLEDSSPDTTYVTQSREAFKLNTLAMRLKMYYDNRNNLNPMS